MTFDTNWERDLELLPEMVAMQNSGITLYDIACAHGLSRRRVRLLLEASSYHCHPIPRRKRPTREQMERRKQLLQDHPIYRAQEEQAMLRRRAYSKKPPMKQPTYNTNWERDLARCAAALEELVRLQQEGKEQPKAPRRKQREENPC